MARYFFHLENDIGAQRDEQGQVFDTDEAAMRHAGRTVGDILSDELGTGKRAASIALFVTFDDGAPVATVTVAARTDRPG